MKSLFIMLICAVTSSSAYASGPNVITHYQDQLRGKVGQVCIKTYAGWGESELTCSAPTGDLDTISKIGAIPPYEKVVDYFKNGFDVKDLYSSIVVNNCSMSNGAKIEVLQLEQEINDLEAKIAELKGNVESYDTSNSCTRRY